MAFKKVKNQIDRKVGFEFELSNISISKVAEIVAEIFDGKIEEKTQLETNI